MAYRQDLVMPGSLHDLGERCAHALVHLLVRLAAVRDEKLTVGRGRIQALVLSLELPEAAFAQTLEPLVGERGAECLPCRDLERVGAAFRGRAVSVIEREPTFEKEPPCRLGLLDTPVGERGVAPSLDLSLNVEESLRDA